MQVEEGRPLAPNGVEIATTPRLCGPVFSPIFFDQHFWIWIFLGGAGLETEGSLYMTIRGRELIPLPLKHDRPFHVWPLPRVGAKPSPGRQNRRRGFWQLKRVRPPLIDSKKCVCVCVRV